MAVSVVFNMEVGVVICDLAHFHAAFLNFKFSLSYGFLQFFD